jgi:thiol-disulfide isomerase/thioredoxin
MKKAKRNLIISSITILVLLIIFTLVVLLRSWNNINKYYLNAPKKTNLSEKSNTNFLILYNIKTKNIDTLRFKNKFAISFFATWCRPCIEEIKVYNDSIKETERVYFFSDEAPEKLNSFMLVNNINLPIYKDTSSLSEKYSIDVFPSTLIFHNDTAIYKIEGQINYSLLSELLSK